MKQATFIDALTGAIVTVGEDGELTVCHSSELPKCKKLFFPGCSMINYAMPLVEEVYSTLSERGAADGISLLCCGKILSYEPNAEVVRPAFDAQLCEHLADTQIEEIICACPNCMLALRLTLGEDERTSHIKLRALPQVLVELGMRISSESLTSAGVSLLCPHDSCPDRDYGEYADGLRDILPSDSWVDPEHSRSNSVCCGSLPRAAGKFDAADKCADLNGREALEVTADAIVTPCMSCAFQLNMAQKHAPAMHFLELLYNKPVDWAATPGWMKVRFLFDDIMGATFADEESARVFAGLKAPGEAGQAADIQAASDVSISNSAID